MLYDFSSIISTLETAGQKVTAEYICEQYDKLMYSIALKILKNEPDAEDAVVQTVINICNNIEHFIGKRPSDIRRMVGRYAYNASVNIYNKNKYVMEHTAVMEDAPISDESLTDDDVDFITDPNHYGELQKYVMQLDTLTQQLLLCRYVYEMSCEEIAKITHIPASTVSTKTNRALKKMKKQYEKDHKDDGGLQ